MKRSVLVGALATACLPFLLPVAGGAADYEFDVPVHIHAPREASFLGRDRLYVLCDLTSTGFPGAAYGTTYLPALDWDGAYEGTVTVSIGGVPSIADDTGYHCYLKNENLQDPLNFRTLKTNLATYGRLTAYRIRTRALTISDR